MRTKTNTLVAILLSCAAISFTGGNLKAQESSSGAADSAQWSPWVQPKVVGHEQSFSFRSSCTPDGTGKAAWIVELQNNELDRYSVSGEKHSSIGTVEPGQVLDVTLSAPNCKKQPEVTAVQQLGSDDDPSLWYIYTYKDGKAKGKLHDNNDPGWLGIAAAVMQEVAAQQQ